MTSSIAAVTVVNYREDDEIVEKVKSIGRTMSGSPFVMVDLEFQTTNKVVTPYVISVCFKDCVAVAILRGQEDLDNFVSDTGLLSFYLLGWDPSMDRKLIQKGNTMHIDIRRFLQKRGVIKPPNKCSPEEMSENTGLAPFVAKNMEIFLTKSLQCSNWEGKISREQVEYCIQDARVLKDIVDKFLGGLIVNFVDELNALTSYELCQEHELFLETTFRTFEGEHKAKVASFHSRAAKKFGKQS